MRQRWANTDPSPGVLPPGSLPQRGSQRYQAGPALASIHLGLHSSVCRGRRRTLATLEWAQKARRSGGWGGSVPSTLPGTQGLSYLSALRPQKPGMYGPQTRPRWDVAALPKAPGPERLAWRQLKQPSVSATVLRRRAHCLASALEMPQRQGGHAETQGPVPEGTHPNALCPVGRGWAWGACQVPFKWPPCLWGSPLGLSVQLRGEVSGVWTEGEGSSWALTWGQQKALRVMVTGL